MPRHSFLELALLRTPMLWLNARISGKLGLFNRNGTGFAFLSDVDLFSSLISCPQGCASMHSRKRYGMVSANQDPGETR